MAARREKLCPARPGEATGLEGLRNIGPQTAWRLREVRIESPQDLRQLGSLEAYRRLKNFDPRFTTLNALYALEGALLDAPWNRLPPGVKERLMHAAAES